MGELGEALEFYRKYNQIAQQLTKSDPTNGESQRDLAISFNKLGDVTRQLEQTDQALAFYEQALEVSRRLADADSADVQAQSDVSVSYERLGDLHHQLGHLEEAMAYFRKNYELRQRIVAADPQNASARLGLVSCIYRFGVVAEGRLEFAEAMDWYAKAIATCEEFENPAFFVKHAGDLKLKLAVCRKAIKSLADLEFALQQSAEEVPGLLALRVAALAAKNDLPGVVATAEANEQLAAQDVQQTYNAACAWAVASGLSKDDVQRREEYAMRALTLLRKTPTGPGQLFDSPAKLAAQMKQDSDVNSLRERSDFQRLLVELGDANEAEEK